MSIYWYILIYTDILVLAVASTKYIGNLIYRSNPNEHMLVYIWCVSKLDVIFRILFSFCWVRSPSHWDSIYYLFWDLIFKNPKIRQLWPKIIQWKSKGLNNGSMGTSLSWRFHCILWGQSWRFLKKQVSKPVKKCFLLLQTLL